MVSVLSMSGESAEAVICAREVLATDAVRPGDRRGYVLHLELARALVREGERAAAIASYQRALELMEGPDGNPQQFESITQELARFDRRR